MRFKKHAVQHKGIGICTINNHTVNSFLMQGGFRKFHIQICNNTVAVYPDYIFKISKYKQYS